jgi:hypothetical protein
MIPAARGSSVGVLMANCCNLVSSQTTAAIGFEWRCTPCSKMLEDSALPGQSSCWDTISFSILSAMKHARFMLLLIVECHFLPSRRRTCIFLLAVFAATLGAMLHGYNLVDSAILFVVAGLSLTQCRLLLALVSSRPGMKSVKIIPLPNAVVAVTMSCSSAAFSKVKISGNSCLSQIHYPRKTLLHRQARQRL